MAAAAMVVGALGGVTGVVPTNTTATTNETYLRSAWTQCGSAQTGGQYDEQRTFYVACGTNVLVKRGTTTTLRPLGVTVSDVASSPDGSILYAVSGSKLIRFDRRADLGYTRHPTWALPNVTFDGRTFAPVVVAVGTDGRGNLYVSQGAPAESVVSKHTPDGRTVTVFGGFSTQPNLGTFYLNRGVAPSRDGRYVYVVEKTGGLIERWDYQVDGTYRPAKQIGRYTTGGSCKDGEFAAPGDAVVDPWGAVYVMDTTCARIQKFTPDLTWIWSKSVLIKSHRLAVDSYGSVFTAEGAQSKLVRSAADAPTATMPALQPLPLPPFETRARGICPAESWTNGAGQAAKDGTVYVACGGSIYVAGPNGTELGRITLPVGPRYYDVAPSPDEAYLYVTRRVAQQGRAELKRFVRSGAAGSLVYTLDEAWKLRDIVLGGRSWTPQGQFVATDVWGDIYFSNGGWSGYYTGAWDGDFTWEASPAVIVKYDPSGAVRTQLTGEKHGDFDINMGVTVSRDGRTVYTVEHKAGRVQRYDYTPSGQYHQTQETSAFGATDSTCAATRGLLTPYDLGVDPWGSLWVANTGCRRADKYTADGTLVHSVKLDGLLHGVAVDLQGNAWIGQRNVHLARTSAEPAPGPVPVTEPLEPPDTSGPVVIELDVPPATSTQSFRVRIRATDAHSIQGMRFAREDGNFLPWEAYSPETTFTASPGFGRKSLAVQLRDEFGQEGEIVHRAFDYVAPPQEPVQPTEPTPEPVQPTEPTPGGNGTAGEPVPGGGGATTGAAATDAPVTGAGGTVVPPAGAGTTSPPIVRPVPARRASVTVKLSPVSRQVRAGSTLVIRAVARSARRVAGRRATLQLAQKVKGRWIVRRNIVRPVARNGAVTFAHKLPRTGAGTWRVRLSIAATGSTSAASTTVHVRVAPPSPLPRSTKPTGHISP